MSALHSEHKYIDLREDQLCPGLTKLICCILQSNVSISSSIQVFSWVYGFGVFCLFLINNLLVN